MILSSTVITTPSGNIVLREWDNKGVREVAFIKFLETLILFQDSQPPGYSTLPDDIKTVAENAFYVRDTKHITHLKERCYFSKEGTLIRMCDDKETSVPVTNPTLPAFLMKENTLVVPPRGFLARILNRG